MSNKTPQILAPGGVIGIIGGGQLGRMTALAAANLGFRTHIFTPEEQSPASQVSYKTTVASYEDISALQLFAREVDVVTFEFENIPHESVKALSASVPVYPGWKALHISQNRVREKNFINTLGINTAIFYPVNSLESLQDAYGKLETNAILKTSELGYDGKGQYVINENTDLRSLWQEIKDTDHKEWVLEGFVNFICEISVVIARGRQGDSVAFPPSKNTHGSGILKVTSAPISDMPVKVLDQAQRIAKEIADALEFVGVMAVEFFVEPTGKLLVNEIAPRPHNSGHWTMDGCVTSQFEQQVRAVCGLDLGSPAVHTPVTMYNLIGDEFHEWNKYISMPSAKLHLYGKKDIRQGRKMGHVNVLGK